MDKENAVSQTLRQHSIRSTVSMTSEYYESDEDMDAYYNDCDEMEESDNEHSNGESAHSNQPNQDPEYFQYTILKTTDAKRMLDECADAVRRTCDVTATHAQDMLQREQWNVTEVVKQLKRNNSHLCDNNNDVDFNQHVSAKRRKTIEIDNSGECMVCFTSEDQLKSSPCGHQFCDDCWRTHVDTQINSGIFSKIQCMDPDCEAVLPEDFAVSLIEDTTLRHKYQEFVFRDRVIGHSELRFCPGRDCDRIVQAKDNMARRVHCSACETSFCFSCSGDYHAPLACSDMKKWFQKCEDDSETANYIVANTKECPKCHVCIEKNGGCNHMRCFKCSHDFCWVCTKNWESHDSYYECSKYKEADEEGEENESNAARSALEKYLFYFQRWENHTKSLQLEEDTLNRIKARIDAKVMASEGTWIDWQYLVDACALLNRCRYTLKFTYPYAYFLHPGSTKDCFEHIQAQLEREVENLSWKVERAEITDRAELEQQMDVAEKRRLTLLHDFLQS